MIVKGVGDNKKFGSVVVPFMTPAAGSNVMPGIIVLISGVRV